MALESVYALQSNKIMLCTGVPLDVSQVRQLSFNDKSEQFNYFKSKAIRFFDDFKYIREHRGVRVPVNAEDIGNVCYMGFQNQTSGKWYYAFVTQVIYINPETSLINFEIDVYQTFMFDMVLRECDISREHSPLGVDYKYNTIPEGIDVGDYEISFTEKYNFNKMWYILISAIDLLSDAGTLEEPKVTGSGGYIVNGVPSAAGVYYIGEGTSDVTHVINRISEYPWVSQSIIGLYAVPSEIAIGGGVLKTSPLGFTVGVINSENNAERALSVLGANWMSHFPVYTNKKMYTFPYSFFEIVMPDGNTSILKPELFTGAPSLMLYGNVVPSPQLFCYPANYDGASDKLFNGIAFSGFPSFPVQSSNYNLIVAQSNATNDLIHSQNRSNLFLDTVLNVGKSLVSLNPLGNVIDAGVEAFKSIRYEEQSAERDRQRIGQYSTGVSLSGACSGAQAALLSLKDFNITVRYYTLKKEYQNILEQFFDAFGYKQNKIAIPDLNTRPRYNYIKCNFVNIYGDIPNEFLQPLRNMFINGFTLWHDRENVGVYGNNGN